MKIKMKPSELLAGNLGTLPHGIHYTYFERNVTRKQVSTLQNRNGRNLKLNYFVMLVLRFRDISLKWLI